MSKNKIRVLGLSIFCLVSFSAIAQAFYTHTCEVTIEDHNSGASNNVYKYDYHTAGEKGRILCDQDKKRHNSLYHDGRAVGYCEIR